MSEYINKYIATRIPVLPKEHRKQFTNYDNADDAFEAGWNEALSCVNVVPSADVIECSAILAKADEQEKQGFIQTAEVLRGLVDD